MADDGFHRPLSRETARPSQPTRPLNDSELDFCTRKLQAQWLQVLEVQNVSHSAPPPVAALTYLSDLPDTWMLGLSAAWHRVPLIVQGLGMKWVGVGVKLPAALRAVQLLNALAAHSMVIVTDGTDTAVTNPTGELAGQRWQEDSVLVSAECGSWPLCYRQLYAKHAAFIACKRASHTCYPNSGAYMGAPAAILRMLPQLVAASTGGLGVEHNGDQSAFNRLYSGGASNIAVDFGR